MTKKLFNMGAFEFIQNYPRYISELEQIIKPELFPVLQKLKDTDPHDLVGPDVWFVSETQARGYVWSLFFQRCKMK